MRRARLLCVGDMHLGRKPSRLPADAPRDVDPRSAFGTVVEAALQHQVDALLLAGDVVESRNGFMEAYGALLKGVKRLRAHGIDVVAVAGNHDVDVLPRLADELEDFHLLGRGGKWDSYVVKRDGDSLVRVLGWSFPTRRFESSPLDSLTSAQGSFEFGDGERSDLRTVGLLHCDLDATSGVYAPVTRAALRNVGISAWFLGHVHAPSIGVASEADAAPIGYLGSLVALDSGEPGVHGPWLAEADAQGWQLEQLPLSPVRWESVRVDVTRCPDAEAVQSALVRSLGALHERIGGGGARVVGIRPQLVGESSLAPHTLREALKSARELDPDHRDDVLYFFDKGQDDTRPALDLALCARGTDPSALLARRLQELEHGGEAAEALIQAARARMLAVTSHANFQGLPTPALTDEGVRALLLRTARRALVELLAQQPSSPAEADAHEEVLA